MQTITVLGVSGSPRRNGNTAKLVRKALEGAAAVSGIETEFYELAGKKIHYCIGCFKCLDTGSCVFQDDFQDFAQRYMAADGIIMGSPVYHMAVPALLKAALERLGNVAACSALRQGKEMPRFSKVYGALTVGGARHGGQEMVMTFLAHSAQTMNGVVVAGGNYIGAAGYLGAAKADLSRGERARSKDLVLEDQEAVQSALNLGKRVAEMARIVREGIAAPGADLPEEYF